MAIFKCKMCGGTVEFEEGATVGVCDSCGTKQTLPKTSDDTVANMFNRANNLRLKCEFDKAEEIYGKILNEDDSEAEAHWGIVLCKYGIEYVDDPATKEKIPTCHRTLFDAITADADYQAAIDDSDAIQQEIYEKEARRIDKIQKDILEIVQKEKPFDVFICYKETDSNGKRTVDSTIANDIYYELTEEGFKVFYAAITLEDKLGQEYEPYIFAALNSAKVMLAIGTAPENFNSVWVKNEWSRYLKLMKTDRTKLLIPCYKDMDAYELPEEFSHLQAQDMSKIGFINDITRGIKKVLTSKQENTTTVKETVVVNNTANATGSYQAFLDRGFMALEDKEWAKADDFFEQALNIDAKLANAYLGKLLVNEKVSVVEDLKNVSQPFDGNNNYQKVIRFADKELANQLKGYIDFINERNESQHLEKLYIDACNLFINSNSEDEFRKAAEQFDKIREFKDSKKKYEDCLKKADEAHVEAIYSDAYQTMKKAEKYKSDKTYYMAKELYQKVIVRFAEISDYKDSKNQITYCKKELEQLEKQIEIDKVEKERKAEAKRIAEEKNAEEKRIAKEKENKKMKRVIILFIVAAIFLVGTELLVTKVIIPNSKYNKAMSLISDGKYVEAVSVLTELGDYKDSITQIENIKPQYQKEILENANVGDTVYYGMYEQDCNTTNGKEDIEWIVLAKEDNRIFVISKYALDCQPYNTELKDVTWETCTLREWLNETFLNTAFSENEQENIPFVTVTADEEGYRMTTAGNSTKDKIFLLNIKEVNKYFASDEDRMCVPTEFASCVGAHISDYDKVDGKSTCSWWLRSPGSYEDFAASVSWDGEVYESGWDVQVDDIAVRPAMWIDLSSIEE